MNSLVVSYLVKSDKMFILSNLEVRKAAEHNLIKILKIQLNRNKQPKKYFASKSNVT